MLNYAGDAGNAGDGFTQESGRGGVAVATRLHISLAREKDLQQNALCPKQSKSKAKMCNGRRHVPLCPASANE